MMRNAKTLVGERSRTPFRHLRAEAADPEKPQRTIENRGLRAAHTDRLIASLSRSIPDRLLTSAHTTCRRFGRFHKMAVSSPRMRKTLGLYALVLACLVVVFIGVGLTLIDNRLTTRDIFGAIGLNLIAAVVFAVIFSVISGRIQERIQSEALAEQYDSFSRDLMMAIAKNNPDYIPINRFVDTETFNPDFNLAITRSLDASQTYYLFRGTSAKYIPVRLRHASNLPELVKVAMLDVKSTRAVRRGASDRHLYIKGKSVDQLAAELIDETLMSLVALYDCRNFCTIEIAFIAALGVTRVELFDDSVYICVRRRGTGRERTPFPGYMQFGPDSFMYTYQKLELLGSPEVANSSVTFDSRTADGELGSILSDISRPTGGRRRDRPLAGIVWRICCGLCTYSSPNR